MQLLIQLHSGFIILLIQLSHTTYQHTTVIGTSVAHHFLARTMS